MHHPAEGTLRRLLDEPAGVADADRQHVRGCSQCLGGLATQREEAALVGAALAPEDGASVDLAAAWRRLSTAHPTAGQVQTQAPARAGRIGAVLRRPIAAVLAVAVVLTGASAAAANDWLQIFRTVRVAPVSLTAANLVALPDLSAYGDVVVTGKPAVHEVPDAASAARESGLDVPKVIDLPRGVVGEPVYQVGRKVSATFTFSADQAAKAAADAGTTPRPVPPGLDRSQVRLNAGPGVAQIWRSSTGAPALVVGRAVAPTAFSSGVQFETLRDYLLALPGMPAEVAAQLRTFTADGSTLPLPVPADRAITRTAQVNGMPATVLTTRDRTLAAVVWVDAGVVTAVAGTLDTGEVLSVARELR